MQEAPVSPKRVANEMRSQTAPSATDSAVRLRLTARSTVAFVELDTTKIGTVDVTKNAAGRIDGWMAGWMDR